MLPLTVSPLRLGRAMARAERIFARGASRVNYVT
jgi:hypothetical protein